MIKKDIKLSDLFDEKMIYHESKFEYAEKKGVAEIIGWKIVLFRMDKNSTCFDAIRLFDIEDEEEAELCNSILKEMGFPVSFNSDISDIYKAFGKEDFTEDHITGCTRYIYSPSEELYIAFDISGNKITGMEIVCSKELIDSILN